MTKNVIIKTFHDFLSHVAEMGLHMDFICVSTMYPIKLEKNIFSDILIKQKCLYVIFYVSFHVYVISHLTFLCILLLVLEKIERKKTFLRIFEGKKFDLCSSE